MKNYTTSVAVVVSGWPSQAESGRLCLVLLSSVFSWALLIIWADFQVEATKNQLIGLKYNRGYYFRCGFYYPVVTITKNAVVEDLGQQPLDFGLEDFKTSI